MPIIAPTKETVFSLDNNVFTHLRNKQSYVLKNIKTHISNTGKLPVIPSMTIFEANFGVQNSLIKNKISNEEANTQLQIIRKLSEMHTTIDFNQKASEVAAYLFASLSKSDKNKHWRDLFIVATAVAHNCGLATQNKRDMELIANNLPKDTFLRLAIWKP